MHQPALIARLSDTDALLRLLASHPDTRGALWRLDETQQVVERRVHTTDDIATKRPDVVGYVVTECQILIAVIFS